MIRLVKQIRSSFQNPVCLCSQYLAQENKTLLEKCFTKPMGVPLLYSVMAQNRTNVPCRIYLILSLTKHQVHHYMFLWEWANRHLINANRHLINSKTPQSTNFILINFPSLSIAHYPRDLMRFRFLMFL